MVIGMEHEEVSGLLVIFYFLMWVFGKFVDLCEN